jgi:hypothetical protein
LGFDKEDDHLIEEENYQRVVAVVDEVNKDEIPKRWAAQKLGMSRPAVDRTELCGI